MTAPAEASAIAPLAGVPPRLRHAVFALAGFVVISSTVGAALSPYLLVQHPLLLVAIAPDGRHVVLAAPSSPAAALIVIGTARRMLAIVAGFGVGFLYGEAAVRWIEGRVPRLARLVRFLERMFERFGLVLLFVAPLPSIGLLAGAARTRLAGVLVAGILGQLTWMTLTVYFGDAISAWTKPLLAFLSRHLIETTIVAVALVGLQQLRAYQKRKARRASEQ